jgi:sulfite reductase (NADPH) flavoprotein alpha-component
MRGELTLQLVEKKLLSGLDSPKEAFHLTFELIPQEVFDFQCGDSVGLWPENVADDIEKVLAHFDIDGAYKIDDIMVRELFQKQYCITHLTESLLDAIYEQLSGEERKRFEEYRSEHGFQTASLLDIIDLFPSVQLPLDNLLPLLKKMKPRLYSIASAVKYCKDRMDLAVVVVGYENFRGRKRYGVASHYLCHRLPLHKPIRGFIARSKFRLPVDYSRDVIMVGPGTGIAPFRAFLQERVVLRASGERVGRNWLFFGEQHRISNFYYEEEFEGWLKSGDLVHLDLAFSRDQSNKIYVQDRMREHGEALWEWITNGGYFYVCGEAAHMAKGVEAALLEIINKYGQIGDPENYLQQLKRENRYQRDVY